MTVSLCRSASEYLKLRDKSNVHTSKRKCFYTSKTLLLYNKSNAFSICSQPILLTNYVVLEIQKDNFPYKSLRFSSNTFHFKSENEQNYTPPHSSLLSASHNLKYKITLIHFINKSFTSLKTK